MHMITALLFLINYTCAVLPNYIENNFGNPLRLEKNNVVNKGVWVRNRGNFDKVSGNFLFKENSVDADRDLNVFGEASPINSPFGYLDRAKRFSDTHLVHTNERRQPQFLIVDLKKFGKKKSLKKRNRLQKHPFPKKSGDKKNKKFKRSLTEQTKCNTKSCENNVEDTASLVKSKLITKLKPASVFNDYPYEIAILLGNNNQALDEAKNYSTYVINEMLKTDAKSTTTDKMGLVDRENEMVSIINTEAHNTGPKRSYEPDVIKKMELNESLNNSRNNIDMTKGYVDRVAPSIDDSKTWHQNAPVPDIHRYKVVSKTEDVNKSVRPVTERGLIKVLSMLTNTFKKIMKQHSDIKEIHKKLNNMNDDFMKNVEIISDKFQDFEQKYTNLVTLNQKIIETEEKLNAKEQHFKAKERELSKNLVEFEIQQKKFLTQQRQFYNIQKMMLAQNERINSKQNAIAKTQSEISHRQNNFARILKKAKQIYIDSKLPPTKVAPVFVKVENSTDMHFNTPEPPESTHTNNIKSPETESVKINLFSIPTVSKLENQDDLLLNEKDEQPVDDLVYKYYFNNTFIDSLMKNFLSGFMSSGEISDIPRTSKNKRGEKLDGTTILLPINKEEKIRSRRWISHPKKKSKKLRTKPKLRSRNILMTVNEKRDTFTLSPNEMLIKATERPIDETVRVEENINDQQKDLRKKDAFITMAIGFCNSIGQNTTTQMLSWCVEKALRRLQNIEVKMPSMPNIEETVSTAVQQQTTTTTALPETETTQKTTSPPLPPSSSAAPAMPAMPAVPKSSTVGHIDPLKQYFPDNEQLESNLQAFDLKPDVEGNVYYDGSLHASELIRGNSESDRLLDRLESTSKMDTIDPDTLDPQAMRRDFLSRTIVSRMKYQSLLKKTTKLRK